VPVRAVGMLIENTDSESAPPCAALDERLGEAGAYKPLRDLLPVIESQIQGQPSASSSWGLCDSSSRFLHCCFSYFAVRGELSFSFSLSWRAGRGFVAPHGFFEGGRILRFLYGVCSTFHREEIERKEEKSCDSDQRANKQPPGTRIGRSQNDCKSPGLPKMIGRHINATQTCLMQNTRNNGTPNSLLAKCCGSRLERIPCTTTGSVQKVNVHTYKAAVIVFTTEKKYRMTVYCTIG
jgi:hypothetical protein